MAKSKKKAAPIKKAALKPNRTLQQLFKHTTPAEARKLATAAGTSVPHLRHVAAGRRNMSADLAQKLATASEKLKNPKLLLNQVDLCKACAHCPLLNGK